MDSIAIQNNIEAWKQKLLDLSKYNNMINYKIKKTKSIQIFSPSLAKILDDIENLEDIDLLKDFESERNEKQWIPLGEEKIIQKKLTNLFRYNRTSENEKGITNCFLSLYNLHYTESDNSQEWIRAPLFFKKIYLEKNNRVNVHNYRIKFCDEEIMENYALMEKLNRDFNIILPKTDGDIPLYIDNISKIFAEKGWYVTPNIIIDNFSYQKQIMYQELVDNPEKYYASSLINKFLNIDEDEKEGNLVPLDYSSDVNGLDVFDADSSQKVVIENAKLGKNMVIQGPPGTGKSQTIANIIINMVADGKTVLFVSQKAAALEVVYNKLEKIDMGKYCLKLHGHNANKKEVVNELYNHLETSFNIPTNIINADIKTYLSSQSALNNYYFSLCEKKEPYNKSLFNINGKIAKLENVPFSNCDFSSLLSYDIEEIDDIRNELEKLDGIFDNSNDPFNSPLYFLKYNDNTQFYNNLELILQKLTTNREIFNFIDNFKQYFKEKMTFKDICFVLDKYKTLENIIDHVFLSLDCDLSLCFNVLNEIMLNYSEIENTKNKAKGLVNVSFFDALTTHEENVLKKSGILSRFFNKEYNNSMRSLRQYELYSLTKNEWTYLFDLKNQYYEKKVKLESLINQNKEILFSLGLHNLDMNTSNYINNIISFQKLLRETKQFGESQRAFILSLSEYQYFDSINKYCESLNNINSFFKCVIIKQDNDYELIRGILDASYGCMEKKAEYIYFLRMINTLNENIVQIITEYYKSKIECSLVDYFDKTYYLLLKNSRQYTPELILPRNEAKILREKGTKNQDNSRIRHIKKLESYKPNLIYDSYGNLSIKLLKREKEKKRRLKPLRVLFYDIEDLIFKIKPCFMMSPLSVCQYINPDFIKFDVVIFDEASQIMIEDAVNCLIRARQLIVAGDTKQLPPTTFFLRDDEEDYEDIELLPSFLSECSTRFPEKLLKWHYRSKDESLITFSNLKYYNNRLFTFPSNSSNPLLGIDFHYVENGIYDRGKSRTNRIEAEEIVTIFNDIRKKYPDKSIGIIAFSISQERAIYQAFENRGVYFDDIKDSPNNEPFFIKNLETVQGDERDIIILSICYGRDGLGKLNYNFGPINKDGGHKRLNVAITRSRYKTIVVSSIRYHDLDDSKLHSEGTNNLKQYLSFAENKNLDLPTVRNDYMFDSDFEEAVYDRLKESGLNLQTQVGCSEYKIDMAVVHPNKPGKYVLGIECDGAQYHSSKFARDRDRIRQKILESQGWHIYRIWSDDWLHNSSNVVRVITELITDLVEKDTEKHPAKYEYEKLDVKENNLKKINLQDMYPKYESVILEINEIGLSEANNYRLSFNSKACKYLYQNANKVMNTEAPITKELLMKRVFSSIGVKKITNKSKKIFDNFFKSYKFEKNLILSNGTVFMTDDKVLVDVRISNEISRPFEYIPIQELGRAIVDILLNSSLDKKGIIHDVPRLIYGYGRVGNNIRKKMEDTIKYLENKKLIVEKNGKYFPFDN